jgi:hypothetical protein
LKSHESRFGSPNPHVGSALHCRERVSVRRGRGQRHVPPAVANGGGEHSFGIPEESGACLAGPRQHARQVSRKWRRNRRGADSRQDRLGPIRKSGQPHAPQNDVCRAHSAPGGGRIRFETDGYFVPRAETTAFWDLASAVYFFDAAGPTYRWLEGRIGVWQGFVDTRKGYSHRYKLTLNEQ